MTMNRESAFAGEVVPTSLLPMPDLAPASDLPYTEIDGEIRLIGSRSHSSGSLAYPPREVCLVTGARDMEPMTFGPHGTLYSFSVVHVSSNRAVPYTIGYVDFENGVRVLAQVQGEESELRCDMPVELRAQGSRWFVQPAGLQA